MRPHPRCGVGGALYRANGPCRGEGVHRLHLQSPLSTIDMLKTGRSCLDVAQQLQAVEKAIEQAKKALIQDHLDHCLEGLVGPLGADQQHAMQEFKEITRYL